MDNETFKILTDTFNNVCFPIACCIALFWTLAKQNKELKQAIDKNTNVLTELKTIISLRNEKQVNI